MSNKPEFIDDLQSELADPMDSRVQDFDMEEVIRQLGEASADLTDPEMAKLADAFVRLAAWVVDVNMSREGADRLVGRRFTSLVWVMNPGMFEGTPSLAALARKMGVTKATLSHYTAEAHRTYGIRNRAQAHGWNFRALPATKRGISDS